MDMKTSVLVPAKGFAHAKRRLASLLNAGERRAAAESMLCHVLEQVRISRCVDETFVVTADAGVARMALSLGAQVIPEREERGESHAVSLALEEMGRGGIPNDALRLADGDGKSACILVSSRQAHG